MVRRVVWAAKSVLQALCIFRLVRVSNLCEHQTKAAFDLKLMVSWGEHKVVLDESGFSAYRVRVDWGLNFLSVRMAMLFAGRLFIPASGASCLLSEPPDERPAAPIEPLLAD